MMHDIECSLPTLGVTKAGKFLQAIAQCNGYIMGSEAIGAQDIRDKHVASCSMFFIVRFHREADLKRFQSLGYITREAPVARACQ